MSIIAVGPGGKTIWFTEKDVYKVGWVNIANKKFTEEKVANNTPGVTGEGPSAIVRSGGAMWFLSDDGETVYRVTANGKGKVMSHDEDYPAGDIAPGSSGGVWLMSGVGGGNSPDALTMVGPNGKGSFYPGTFDNLLDAMALGPRRSSLVQPRRQLAEHHERGPSGTQPPGDLRTARPNLVVRVQPQRRGVLHGVHS